MGFPWQHICCFYSDLCIYIRHSSIHRPAFSLDYIRLGYSAYPPKSKSFPSRVQEASSLISGLGKLLWYIPLYNLPSLHQKQLKHEEMYASTNSSPSPPSLSHKDGKDITISFLLGDIHVPHSMRFSHVVLTVNGTHHHLL